MRTILMCSTMVGFLVLGACLEGVHLQAFIQPTSAVIVFGPILAFLVFSLGLAGCWDMTKSIFSGKLDAAMNDALDRASMIGFLCGGISAVLGLIHVMGNLSDSSKLGAGISVAFIGVFYGALPALLTTALSTKTTPTLQLRKNAPPFVAASVLMLLFSFFVILYALSSQRLTKRENVSERRSTATTHFS